MARWAYAAYALLVIVGTANREVTGLLLVLAWLGLRPREWRWGFIFAALALATYATIDFGVGNQPNTYTLASVWRENTTPRYFTAAVIYNALLSPLWLAGAASWRKSAPALRRLALTVIPVYLALWFGLAVWQEARLLMPVLILMLPMVTSNRHHRVVGRDAQGTTEDAGEPRQNAPGPTPGRE